MSLCMQGVLSDGNDLDSSAPLKHASSFSEKPLLRDISFADSAVRKSESFAEGVIPVRNTFIHFTRDEFDDELSDSTRLCHSCSSPAIILSVEFHTMYPLMEAAHLSGECRPCFYFIMKGDGCRWGGDCEFCHLCPKGAFDKKKKEKIRLLRQKAYLAKIERKQKPEMLPNNKASTKFSTIAT